MKNGILVSMLALSLYLPGMKVYAEIYRYIVSMS